MQTADLPVGRQDISGSSHGEIYTFGSFSLSRFPDHFFSQLD